MRELSLHILDVVENAIEAGASCVDLCIVEDLCLDRLTISVRDNGCGMDAGMVQKVRDPFFTTRTTRHVGLGIPLFAAAAEQCNGTLIIESVPGQGTTVTATFQHSHLDRAPLGDMAGTLMAILMRRPDAALPSGATSVALRYVHRVDDAAGGQRTFEFDSTEIEQVLGSLSFSHPDVRRWLSAYIVQGEQDLQRI